MIENEHKSFTNILIFFSEIMVAKHGVCGHDFRKEIKILVQTFFLSIIVFNMMQNLPMLQVKAGKPMIKESYRGLTGFHFYARHWLSSFILFSSSFLSYCHHISLTTSGMSQQCS